MTDEKDNVEEIAEASGRVEKARGAVNEKVAAAKEKLSGASQAAGKKLGEVSEVAGKKLGEASETAGKKLKEVKGQAGEATQAAREKTVEGLKQGYDRVRKDFDDLGGDVNAYVRDNPGRSILIAAGVGFVLGMLLRRDR